MRDVGPESERLEDGADMRRIPMHVICAAIVFAVAVIPARGERVGLKGRQELSFSWQYQTLPAVLGYGEGRASQATISASYGVFVWPNVELKAGVSYYCMSAPDEVDPYGSGGWSSWSIAPSIAYHFLPKRGSVVVPYAGIGATYYGQSNSFYYGGSGRRPTIGFTFAGAKFFLGGDYTKARHAIFLEGREQEDSLIVTIGFLSFL
jgi:hypothetical protein